MIKAVESWTQSIIADLKSEYVSINRKASGNWANLLSYKIKDNNNGVDIDIYGAFYTRWMEDGRSPNSNKKNNKGFAAWASQSDSSNGGGFIYTWCQDKGIDTKFAFPIALKIAEKGYEGKPLVNRIINEESVKQLTKNTINSLKFETITTLKNVNN
jgi:hypothetical protein